jgi:hypothetical protein
MENFKLLFQIYLRPASGFSEIMDKGSWLFAAVAVLVVSFAFQFAVNSKIMQSYAVSQTDFYFSDPGFDTSGSPDGRLTAEQLAEAEFHANAERARELNPDKRPFPLIGKSIFYFFSFDSSFFTPLITISLFYIPANIILLTLFAQLGAVGTVLRRDYATLANCGLMAWTAAHLPFVIAALLMPSIDGSIFLGFWFLSGMLFGGLLVFAMRTVFGVEFIHAILTVAISWIFYCGGTYVFQFISPWLFSPFLLFFALIYLGGFLGNEVRGVGSAMRQKREFKRFLQNATVNPNDADAHLQLGLIYKQRRQDEKALEHFSKAFEIDNEEIDANFELGIISRQSGNLQKAIEHFSVVVEQNDKYSLSEVWREIGRTYFEGDMLKEAREALEKFVVRRPFDAEGLYYLGKILQETGENAEAAKMFERVVEAVKTAAYYRRGELQKWSRLAKKEL